MSSPTAKVNTPVALGIIGFACLCVVLLGALVWAGKDIGTVLTAIVTIIPATIGIVVVSAQTKEVQSAVNGKLDAKFNAIHAKIDDQHMETHARLDAANIPPVSPIVKRAIAARKARREEVE